MVYTPDKTNSIFEQKINLKFHKAYDAGANLIKQHATLNLNVKSTLDLDNLDGVGQFTPRTDMKTADHRRFLSDIDDSLIFDIEDSMMMNSQINDISMISISSVSKPKTKHRPTDSLNGGSQSYRSMQKEVTRDFDMGKFCYYFHSFYARITYNNLDCFKSINTVSQETLNSSQMKQNSYRGEINSEKSYPEMDSQGVKNKSEFEASLNDKNQTICDLKQELVLKRIRITKQEQKISELSKDLEKGIVF